MGFPPLSYVLPMRTLGCVATLSALVVGCTAGTDTATETYEMRLAEHLTDTGASMYGAFWCPHCADQKELFGDAAKAIPYVECDPEGENAQPEVCQAKGIEGYPTWEINGELYVGTQTLDELAKASNFEAPTNSAP